MGSDYYSIVRLDAIALMDDNGSQRVLELGCGAGCTLEELRVRGLASFLAGVELEPACHAAARGVCDLFVPGNVEEIPLQDLGRYDTVLLLDVIEHLANPFAVIQSAASVLNPGGYLVLSFPNVRNFGVIKPLVMDGLWDYQDSGIFDRGHLRFFTRKSFLSAMAQACPALELEVLQGKPNRSTWLLQVLSCLPWVGEFFTCQFMVKYRLSGETPS